MNEPENAPLVPVRLDCPPKAEYSWGDMMDLASTGHEVAAAPPPYPPSPDPRKPLLLVRFSS